MANFWLTPTPVTAWQTTFELKPSARGSAPGSVQELAIASARRCFWEVDLNNDGYIEFDEFLEWYNDSGGDTRLRNSLVESASLLVQLNGMLCRLCVAAIDGTLGDLMIDWLRSVCYRLEGTAER